MSAEYKNQDPLDIAKQAERDLNSQAAKQGHQLADKATGAHGASDSTKESGVDESVEKKFPGASVTYGSAASGAGDNRDIPESEGGGINPVTGQLYKARDFEGVGGPEDKAKILERDQGGRDDVRSNIRQ
ncbi:unnamed protein product [Periconia digitata]|uniref:Uncharacterized protein n=1 Tax=Periconia digitata TaxID=1303443 RepID=A0A9W4UWB7_9PLEO|nr:unnamed protein product [Periconia digitata]